VYKDKTKQQLLVHVPMAKTKIFPLNFAGEKQARKASFLDEEVFMHQPQGYEVEDMKQHQQEATIIHCDNQSTIAMTKNPMSHSRTRHFFY